MPENQSLLLIGARTRVSLVRETVFNFVPTSPVFQTERPTDLTLGITPKFAQSKEIRQDGMDAPQILVDQDVTAKLGIEFSINSVDDIIEAALRTTKVASGELVNATAGSSITSVTVTSGVYNTLSGGGNLFPVGALVKASGFVASANNATARVSAQTSSSVTLTGVATVADASPAAGARLKQLGIRAAAAGSIAATTGPNALTMATTNPTTLGIVPGMWIRPSGFTGTTANNDLVRVSSITGSGPWTINLDIVPTGWGADTAAGQVVDLYFTDYFRPGTTRNSYTIEEAHLDVGDYKYGTGMVIDSYMETLKPGATIPIAVQMVGMNGGWGPQASGATYVPRTTTTALNTSNNMGKAYVNGAWISGVITSADYTFKANAKVQKAVGGFGGVDVTYGAFQVSGSLEKFFIDTTLNALMMAGTPTTLVFVKRDPTTGTTYVVEISSAVLQDGQPAIANATDPLKEPYKWVGQVGPNGYMAHIQKLEVLPAVGV